MSGLLQDLGGGVKTSRAQEEGTTGCGQGDLATLHPASVCAQYHAQPAAGAHVLGPERTPESSVGTGSSTPFLPPASQEAPREQHGRRATSGANGSAGGRLLAFPCLRPELSCTRELRGQGQAIRLHLGLREPHQRPLGSQDRSQDELLSGAIQERGFFPSDCHADHDCADYHHVY